MIAAALLFLRRVPSWAWIALALLAAGLFYGHLRFNAGQADVQARWDAREAVYATQRAEATIAARNTEARHRAELKAVADRFLKEQSDADQKHTADLARLRDGTLRVRDRFTCPAVPGAAADPGVADGAGARGLQPADLGLLLDLGHEADAIARRLNALQDACRVR